MLTLKQCRALHRLIDEIYDRASDLELTWEQLADRAGVGVATVYRLGNYETMFPRLQTVHMLAKAVGLELSFELKQAHRRVG